MTREGICNVEPVTMADTIMVISAMKVMDLLGTDELEALDSILNDRWEPAVEEDE